MSTSEPFEGKIGRNALSPVTDDYSAPFRFTGVFHKLDIDLLRHQHSGLEEEDARQATQAVIHQDPGAGMNRNRRSIRELSCAR